MTGSNKAWKAPLVWVLLLFTVTGQLNAQNLSQTVRGTVIDQESQSPLPGANVIIVSTNPSMGTATNFDGEFRLEEVPVGRHQLVISFLGYEDVVIKELLVGSAKEIILTIPMEESFTTMDEVVLTDKKDVRETQNENITLSARSFTVEETKRYAASINDPSRMALSYAGVSNTGDFNNEIVIRGNSPTGLLWRLEGIEIPNPNHFGDEGSSGGGVSILSANMLSNSDFLTGAFPGEYGNAFSGVFDIQLRNGNNEKKEFALQAGLLGVDFSAEGPMDQNGSSSFLMNYRYSSLAILNPLIDITGDVVPTFQDGAFKFDVKTKNMGRFSFWGIGGLSEQTDEADPYEPNAFRSDMGAMGIANQYFFNERSYLKTIVSLSASLNSFRRDLVNPLGSTLDYRQRFERINLRGSFMYNYKKNVKNTFRFGLIGSQIQYDILAEGINDDTNNFQNYINSDGRTHILQSYAQWKYKWHKDWTLNSGIHGIFVAHNQTYSIEPRLGVKWQFSPSESFGLAAGLHSKALTVTNYLVKNDDGIQANKDLELPKSLHLVFAYNKALNDRLFLKSEVYYQHLYDIPVKTADQTTAGDLAFSMLNYSGGYTRDPLINDGTGTNYGLELTLERPLHNGSYYMITASIFDAKYKGSDGIERNSRYNANYVFNALMGKEYKVGKQKNNILGFNIRTIWKGGNRDTPIDQQASIEERDIVYDWTQAYSQRLADYFRLDFSISFRKNKPKHASIISLDIQNITNRNNILRYDYEFDFANFRIVKERENQLGLIPVLNYRLEF